MSIIVASVSTNIMFMEICGRYGALIFVFEGKVLRNEEAIRKV